MEQQPPAEQRIGWFGMTIVAIILVVIALVALLIALGIVILAAPLIIAAVLWFLLHFYIASHERAPYAYSRVALGLLVAWFVDALLYRGLYAADPHVVRHYSPAIIVVSAFSGFVSWNSAPTREAEPSSDFGSKPSHYNHPFCGRVSFLLMLFVMTYVVMPVLTHYVPTYNGFFVNLINGIVDASQ